MAERFIRAGCRVGKTAVASPAELTEVAERLKYEKIWTFADYRRTSPAESAVERAWDRLGLKHGVTLIDFGCGPGRASRAFTVRGVQVLGVDIARNCLDDDVNVMFLRACLWDLPVVEAQYGFCVDVMEHIPTEFVSDVLENIACATTEGVYFEICTTKDGLGQRLIGEPLHLTVRSAEWWQAMLKSHWTRLTVLDSGPAHVNVVCRP